MKGLLLKDLLILRKQFKSMILIFIFYAFLGFFADNYDFLAAFIPFIFTLMVLTSFSFDDASKWQGYALSLPISRSQLVLSKYLLALLLALASTVFSSLYGYFMLFILKKPITGELLTSALVAAGLCLLFICILLPITFRFGTEKSRYAMFVIFMIPFLLLLLAEKTGFTEQIDLSFINDALFLKYLTIGGTITLLIFFTISILISKQIVEKMEY